MSDDIVEVEDTQIVNPSSDPNVTIVRETNWNTVEVISAGPPGPAGPAVPISDGDYSLGSTSIGWANLYLSDGATVDFGQGDFTITHSAGTLDFSALFSVGGSNVLIASDIGTLVQAYDADLTAWAGVNPSSYYTSAQVDALIAALPTDTEEEVQDIVGAMFSSNTETLVTVTYQDADGTIDVVVDNDLSHYDNTTSSFATTAAVAAGYQPLDSDLTSWAALTRASGFDTFVATPSSANLASLVTGETGSGALVFGTAPTLSTVSVSSGGLGFGSTVVASATDLSTHLRLYSTTYGISITAAAFNMVSGGVNFLSSTTTAITSKINHDFSAGIDVTGNITVTGTVDGVDVAALDTRVTTIEGDYLVAADIATALFDSDIGVTVQAYDADLTTWAGLTPSANAQSLVTAANYAAMRALLDLEAGTDFYTISAADAAIAAAVANYTLTTDLASTATGKGASLIGIYDSGALITATTVEGALAENRTAIDAIEADYLVAADIAAAVGSITQAWSATLDGLSALSPTAFGKSLLELASATALRTAIALPTTTTVGRLARYTDTAGAQGATAGIYEDAGGQIGIGTATPNKTLDVNGTLAAKALAATNSAGSSQQAATLKNTADNASLKVAQFSAARSGTPASIDNGYVSFTVKNSAGADFGMASLGWYAIDVTSGSEDSAMTLGVVANGVGASYWLYPTYFRPPSNDGAALGNSWVAWSDLFLASGGVINFASSDLTLTHSASTLTSNGHFLSSMASAKFGSSSWGAFQFNNALTIGVLFSGAQRNVIGAGYITLQAGGSYRWASDSNANTPDTYLKRTAANTVELSSDGSTGAANLNVLGKLGVGTQSPACTLDVNGPVRVKSYTVATAPSAAVAAGQIIYVSDESSGATLAFSDGTDWRRASDRAVIS